MIKISFFTAKEYTMGNNSLSVVRVKSGKDDYINTLVMNDSKTVRYMDLMSLVFALKAIGESEGDIEVHTTGNTISEILEEKDGGWPKHLRQFSSDINAVEFIREKSKKYNSFKVRKLHKQEIGFMKKIADENLDKIK